MDAALRAAARAGEILRTYDAPKRAALQIHTKSSAHDFVTEADVAVQREIVAILCAAFPAHRYIGEEEGADGIGDASCPYAWTVDPIDGTTNFIHGKPTIGTMIALLRGEETLLGVIHRPFFGDTFHAVKGQGAFRDGQPLVLRKARDMDDAVICMNLRRGAQRHHDGTVDVRIPACASVENYGCAVESFCQVLLGHNDGVMYDGPHLWDVAPGCLLVAEAGGFERHALRDPADPRGSARCAAAATKGIFERLEAFTFKD